MTRPPPLVMLATCTTSFSSIPYSLVSFSSVASEPIYANRFRYPRLMYFAS
jgi:hypothetical protein